MVGSQRDYAASRAALAFPADADVLLAVRTLETLLRRCCRGVHAAASETILDDFLLKRRGDVVGDVSPPLTSSSCCVSSPFSPGAWGTLTICPRRSPPPSPSLLKKNARVALIENYCDMREYNYMLKRDGGGGAAPNKQLSSRILPTTSGGSGGGGPAPRLDPALSKLGMNRKELSEIASLVHQPFTSRDGVVTASGRNTSAATEKESYSSFMKDLTIGIDMRLMSLAGGVVGYYLCYSRGQPVDMCLVGAAVGAVAMLLMDAVLLLIRLSKEDGQLTMRRRGGGDGSGMEQTPLAHTEGRARKEKEA